MAEIMLKILWGLRSIRNTHATIWSIQMQMLTNTTHIKCNMEEVLKCSHRLFPSLVHFSYQLCVLQYELSVYAWLFSMPVKYLLNVLLNSCHDISEIC